MVIVCPPFALSLIDGLDEEADSEADEDEDACGGNRS